MAELTYTRVMKPRWKLTVEGLGKIERAEVEVRPLTLFVGPNNSGKSYLASLLWGLVAMHGELASPEGPERDAVDAWIAQHMVDVTTPIAYDLTPDDIHLFERFFDSIVNANRAKLVTRIFNSDLITAKNISFKNRSETRQARLSWLPDADGAYRVVITDGEDGRSLETSLRPRDLNEARQLVRDILARRITFYRLMRLFLPFEDVYSHIDPIYLPASRTGFMQLYKAPARRSFHDAFRRKEAPGDWLELTTSSFHFLDMLTFGLKEKRAARYAKEADLLEQTLTGRIELIQTRGVNEYRYHPAGAGLALTMNLSSALVTELAPLILVLRHVSSLPVLVLEEPEAHLHPELQRRVAQVIVRLIRKGLYVWITTHSENFCQQLNNFIKLGSLPQDKRADAQHRLGYDSEDYLELDDVSGYEFKLDDSGHHSNVVEMKRTHAGLVMPTFNTALLKLGEEIDYLDGTLEQVP